MLFRRLTLSIAIVAGVCQGQNISTYAGGGSTGGCTAPDGSQASKACLTALGAITMDRLGNLYFAESGVVRKIDTNGVLSTVAGNGTPGYTGDGGPATKAEVFSPTGLVVDSAGNVYISDAQNQVVRKVDTSGTITTIAGNGTPGYLGDGQPARQAELQFPAGIALDSAGNLYIADQSNNRVRKVDTAGIITTFAGNGNVVYSGDGVQANTTVVHEPGNVAVDSAGNVYISETSDDRVRKVDPTGIISTFAGLTKKTAGFSGDNGPATAATLKGPRGLVADHFGNVYIADGQNSRVRKVDAAGIITTFAGIDGTASTPIGDGGPATSAFLGNVSDVAVDPAQNVYIAASASGPRIRKVTVAAGLTTSPTSLSFAYTIGGTAPAAQQLNITSSGAAMTFTAAASITSGGSNWLSVSPASGTTPATLNVSVNPSGIPGGIYQGAITLTPAGGSPQAFSVTLTVTGAGAPVFTSAGVVNASGYQNKLAPDTVFVIFGSGMGPSTLASATAPNYPNNLSGTSITFTPAGGGAAISAKMIYTFAGQIAGLLPSSITPGTYAVQVTYNTLASAPQNVTVVARSFGIATANSQGTGVPQATIGNVNSGLSLTRFTTGSVQYLGYTWTLSPAHPGDTLVLWGTGGGADAANDTGGTSGDQTQAGNFVVNVSGRQVTPLYAGASSGYPGLWQVNFTLPSDLTPRCFVAVQVSAGGELSNTVTIPVATAGQTACSDPQLSPDQLKLLDSGGTVTIGGLGVTKEVVTETIVTTPGATPSTTTVNQELASAAFLSYNATEYAAVFGGIQIGPCYVRDTTSSPTIKPATTPAGYLDAGARLPLSGPGIAAGAALGVISTNPGPIYDMPLTSGTLTGGTYSMSGSGGKDVGAFNASVNFPSGFTVSNWDSITTIVRSQPLTVSWTGTGFNQVIIIGSTSAVVGKDSSNGNITHTVAFTCEVPAAPGSYTIPTSVLSYLLPATIVASQAASGTGILAVEAGNIQPFTAPLVSGGQIAYGGFSGTVAYSRNLSVQ